MSKNEEIHVKSPSGDADRYLIKAKQLALEVYNGTTDGDSLTLGDLYIVWFAKELQNWKALVATNVSGDGLYFEVTYDGDRHQAYVDKYGKLANFVIADIPEH